MRLDQRLRLLRGQAAPQGQVDGRVAEPSAVDSSPDRAGLSERLSRLSTTARRPALKSERDEPALVAVLGATRIVTGVLCLERRLPLSWRQGRFQLGACVTALPLLRDESPVTPDRWLFLDTETSGLAGGTGTWAFLTGLARIDGVDLLLRQYLLTRLDAEADYLTAVQAELDQAGLLITFNGKSFDAPLLTTRLRLAGIRGGLDTKPHFDLLHPTRRAFARVWSDCRLASVEQRLLGVHRKGDLSGAEAPQAWLAWLRCGETMPLTGVLNHNRQDLLSLPALVSALALSLYSPDTMGADVGAVARYWLVRGDEAKAYSILSNGRDRLDDADLLELARLHRRRDEWTEAERIWRTLADRDLPQAIDALVKYLEHKQRNYPQALALVDRLPAGPDREHRQHRLETKLRTRMRGLGLRRAV